MRYMLGRRIPFLIALLLALPHLFRIVGRLLRHPRVTASNRIPEVAALMLLVTFTGIYSLFGAFHSRYRLPLELALLVFAAGTVSALLLRRDEVSLTQKET
jgi:uncharacterized membrane protein